jgi:hypothetical protein
MEEVDIMFVIIVQSKSMFGFVVIVVVWSETMLLVFLFTTIDLLWCRFGGDEQEEGDVRFFFS